MSTDPKAEDKLPHETPDFSLVLGGPLYQLYRKTRLAGSALELLRRRIAAFVTITWLPLLILTVVGGTAWGGDLKVPFLRDIEAHVRFLIALPALIIAELIVHQRIRPIVRQFVNRGIVVNDEVPKFRQIIESGLRVRNSVFVEVFMLIVVFTFGTWLWRDQIALPNATWYAIPTGEGLHLTWAGRWYSYVSIPIFQFVLLRWYARLLLWYWFLWRVSRLELQLMPTHPDRAGGLGFLAGSAYAFGPVLFAQGALLSGVIANSIFFEGRTLVSYKVDIFGLVLLFVVFVLGPLCMFSVKLNRAKRMGNRDYGMLASRYTQEFDQKWIRSSEAGRGELLGSSDIQSLADLGNSISVIRDMRLVPFGWQAVMTLAATTVAPILPLFLTMLPLDEIVDRLLQIIL